MSFVIEATTVREKHTPHPRSKASADGVAPSASPSTNELQKKRAGSACQRVAVCKELVLAQLSPRRRRISDQQVVRFVVELLQVVGVEREIDLFLRVCIELALLILRWIDDARQRVFDRFK